MSKVILYMAISSDGYIAGPNDEAPWSDAEWEAFNIFVKSCDCVLLGKRTYEIMRKDGEFVSGPEYIVVTTSQSLNTGGLRKIVVNSEADLPNVDKIGVIGGGELNGRLADLGVIDEVILDVEQVELGDGIKLFGNHKPLNMRLISEKTLRNGTTVQKHYQVV
jgi:dihydrofolate reductase